MQCSYCKIVGMEIRVMQVKREVPLGAKDMGFHDEVTVWQCPQCGQTSDEGILKCKKCGIACISQEYYTINANAPKILKTMRDYKGQEHSGCSNCVKCRLCEQPLGIGEFEMQDESFNMNKYYHYSHSSCVTRVRVTRDTQERQAALQEQQVAIQEHGDEETRQYRLGNGLCLKCCKPLGLMDKVAGRNTHKRC